MFIPLRNRRAASSVSPQLVALYAIATAYGGAFWLVVLRRAEGDYERHQTPLLLEWLRNATLALPLIVVAAAAGLMLASWARERWEIRSRLSSGALTATLIAYLASCSLAVTSRAQGAILGLHDAHPLALPVMVLRDGAVEAFGARTEVLGGPRRAGPPGAGAGGR
jgi:hypothetical protein